jgi:cytochrome oxidase Cu insertion factor (SCO1/SenC/PrrC family)
MPITARLSAVALALAVAATSLAQQPKDRRREGTIKVGDAAPTVTADELSSGKTVPLADLRGKPTVLIFGSCT